ncbi:nucleotide sugar dehydrogenase [Thermodesulfobacteriota bacterium]
MQKNSQILIDKINNKEANIAVIGMGYVGLPIAIEFANAGFNVIGLDINKEKVKSINKGISHIRDISNDKLKKVIKEKRLRASTDYDLLHEVDAISICVPTPLRKTKDPDISYILSATHEIKKRLTKGQLVVLVSTTYPGTTTEVIQPVLEQSGLVIGKDIYLSFSPERVDPGNPVFKTKNTPKIVSGVTKTCAKISKALYSQIIDTVIEVSSTQAAEMVKLLENTFRSVNIALVNETAIICDKLGLNVWEIINAAATKPFGFMPFYPGPGLGGHCIPIDPHYLSWKLKTLNYNAKFIELAGEINSSMPKFVVNKVTNALNKAKKSVNSSKILILGVSYKKDIDDIRESPALDIIYLLKNLGAKVSFNDPYVGSLDNESLNLKSLKLTEKCLKSKDCVVIATDHSDYDYKFIVKNSTIVVDARNATKNINSKNIVRL